MLLIPDRRGESPSQATHKPTTKGKENIGRMSIAKAHSSIQNYILSMEQNQERMAQLNAAGYNLTHPDAVGEQVDLWKAPCIELPCYLSKRESPDHRKLTNVLRTLWGEWRDLLLAAGIAKITVEDKEVEVGTLFRPGSSLKYMELEVLAAKKVTSNMTSEEIRSKRTRLISKEEFTREGISKLRKVVKVRMHLFFYLVC